MLDVDGVLTDGRLWLGPHGEEWKSFHVHDGLAIVRAIAAGLVVAVVSARQSAVVARRCAELGVTEVHQGVSDKLTAYQDLSRRHGCRDEVVAAMGDDLADLPVLGRVALAVAPADAVPEVRAGRPLGDEAARGRWSRARGSGGNSKSAESLAALTRESASNPR